jgi:hypothetical protein
MIDRDITITFDNRGDFAAHAAAVSYLRARRFSVGPMQGDDPIAVLFGINICVGKWRTISQAFRETVDGTIEPAGGATMRTGPVIVTIRARASAAARAAVSNTSSVRVAS